MTDDTDSMKNAKLQDIANAALNVAKAEMELRSARERLNKRIAEIQELIKDTLDAYGETNDS